jgi:RimJ/RimL family protein N-acetyltransferase
MHVPSLGTERLKLRAWRAEDAAALAVVNADPEVMRWVGDGSALDRRGSDALLARIEEQWRARGFGLWAVEARGRPGLLGFCGLSVPWFLPELLPAVEIGWRLGRGAWGRGYATEAARSVLAHGFGELSLPEILATVFPENVRSVRVTEKLGMAHVATSTHPGGRPVAIYSARHHLPLVPGLHSAV